MSLPGGKKGGGKGPAKDKKDDESKENIIKAGKFGYFVNENIILYINSKEDYIYLYKNNIKMPEK